MNPPVTRMFQLSRCLGLVLCLGLASLAAHAQYPNRAVRLVTPFGPGSASDTLLRTLAEPLGAALGQSVVVSTAGPAP